MRSISNIWDVVDWGLCIGCGACAYACDRNAVTLKNIEAIGIRPFFERQACRGCAQCLEFCPGYRVVVGTVERAQPNEESYRFLIGSAIEIWEGAATDEKMRFSASSGGALSALALYCIEKENMEFVLHTGMNPQRPWENITVLSHGREELLQHTGSRYATSSPCDGLRQIEESGRPCVFVGKPCDAAAVSALRRLRPKLDEKLGLVLSFFCAGTPSAKATIDLMHQQGVVQENVKALRYRGEGWPGWFTVTDRDGADKKLLSYRDSWHFLQKYRPFRCKLCPDGLGELADISCGDAWHRFSEENKNPGLSLVLTRTKNGQDVLDRAIKAGYLTLEKSSSKSVIKAQGLAERRKEIFGRQFAMRVLMVPTTKFVGFQLFKAWMATSNLEKIKSILGTIRRLLQRGLWHRNKISGG